MAVINRLMTTYAPAMACLKMLMKWILPAVNIYGECSVLKQYNCNEIGMNDEKRNFDTHLFCDSKGSKDKKNPSS